MGQKDTRMKNYRFTPGTAIALPAGAFSPDGYIIAQGKATSVPYGRFTSNWNGCGWIAAYNLLKITGRAEDWRLVSRALARGLTAEGALGTGPLRLARYLRGKGLRLETATSRIGAARLARFGSSGILLYATKEGPHYVAFADAKLGRHRFFNAEEGNSNHISTMAGFLKKEAKLPFVYLMLVKNR